jgi:hypothetical protein
LVGRRGFHPHIRMGKKGLGRANIPGFEFQYGFASYCYV